jgi:hypothetical protein
MSNPFIEFQRKAAEHHEHAARHHREAAARHEAGDLHAAGIMPTSHKATFITPLTTLQKHLSTTPTPTPSMRNPLRVDVYRAGRILGRGTNACAPAIPAAFRAATVRFETGPN